MKHYLFSAFMLLLFINAFHAQIYNDRDKEGLRKLLDQPSEIEGKQNWELAGLNSEDIKDWETSEEWIEKLKGTYFWTYDVPKRITQIDMNFYGNGRLAGAFDGSYFSELTNLNLGNNSLTSLDIKKNIKLRFLNISHNQLTTIDVSNNIDLSSLMISRNHLKLIDVSKNIQLFLLWLDGNQIEDLDISQNINLTNLVISDNKLKNLNIFSNVKLEDLRIGQNQISEMDLSKNIELDFLDISGNKITTLDLSNQKLLNKLDCRSNRINNLKLPDKTQLEILSLQGNNFLLSTLPLPTSVKDSGNYGYWDQKLIRVGKVQVGVPIDLSSEYLINGKKTTYQWFKGD